VADFSVFNVQFSYALLVTLEKQVYDFFIVYHLTASFPASPIYYGFGGACYIKSRISGTKLYHTLMRLLPAGASLPQAASHAGYGKNRISCLRTDAPFPPKKQTVLGTKKPSTAYFLLADPV
jgi:hypothetical protein